MTNDAKQGVNMPATKGELRRFGHTMAAVLVLVGALWLWRGRGAPMFAFSVAAVFALLAMAAPALLRPIHWGWMKLALILGWVMTRVILSLLFYLVFTPVGWVGKLAGKRFLDLDMKRPAETFWIRKEQPPADASRYEKQF